MKYIRLGLESALAFLVIHTYSLSWGTQGRAAYIVASIILFLFINIIPSWSRRPTKKLRILSNGVQLLEIFLLTTCAAGFYMCWLYRYGWSGNKSLVIIQLVFTILAECILFWNGIIRVYLTSRQLGIKWRIIGCICGWMPIIHLYVLGKIILLTSGEAEFESNKILINEKRKTQEICKTKYPVLLVHGVFFRDFRFFDYWGRISDELKKNGAIIYYGQQQSAASVEECGRELAARIEDIVMSTGRGKVNIIAHSKGGLDSRSAISAAGAAPYVASLTTINTPHQGCIFAEYLLQKIPKKVRQSIAGKYNGTLRHFGDTNPDFISAVTDLTASACAKRNESLINEPAIYYQSVASKMNIARSGRFPLNLAYPLVKHFDGDNDGLVAVNSAKWGEKFIFLKVPGGRGISHGDIIDLNRENIKGFDVREFYVELVADLKKRGL